MERDTERRIHAGHADSGEADDTHDRAICPFCGSRETELLSPFGSQLSTAQYLCRACRSPFERIRQDEPQGTY
jgi:DNA-directed RNA polymerase subunit RPC12/RpoP